MEDQTRNPLEASLQQWRRQYEAQETFSPSQMEELESHLRESAESLVSIGLTNDEAFLIATRRLGQPTALAQQFQTNGGASWWSRRLLWMLGGIVAYHALEMIQSIFQLPLYFFYGHRTTPEQLRAMCLWRLIIVVGSVVLLWLALRKQGSFSRRAFQKIPAVAWQALLIVLMILRPVTWAVDWIQHPNNFGYPWLQILQLIGSLWPLGWMVLFLVVWRRSRAAASLTPQPSAS